MDDLGFNKIAAAILGTALGVLVLMKVPALIMDNHPSDGMAYSVGPVETAHASEAVIDLPFPQQSWIDAMDAEKGAKVFKKCSSCHNVAAGGPNGAGPNLHALLGKDKATHEGYSYSSALTDLPGNWTFEDLDGFLKKPSDFAPGTKMGFIGLKKEADRAAVIEYLRLAASAPMAQPIAAAGDAPSETITTEGHAPIEVPAELTITLPDEGHALPINPH